MVAVTSVMRAHQILLARVENALRPYDLSFSRYELLRLLAFSSSGALPITKASDHLQVHVTSVTHAIRRLEVDGLVRTGAASERRPHHAGAIDGAGPVHGGGRDRDVEQEVFADIGITADESRSLVAAIETLRHNAGDF